MKAANNKQTFFNYRKCAYILFGLTLSLILGSCESPGKADIEIEKKEIYDDSSSATKNGVHVLNFYKQLYGSIGKHNITMVLHANENKLSGNYFYFKVGVQLRLVGEISADNTYQLFEIAPGGDTTGVFKGLLKNEEGLSGTWTNVKTKQIFPFVFSERDTSAYVKFTKEHYEQSNCIDADSVKALKLDSLVNWYDTACTVREIQLLRFLLPDKKLADKIYATLLNEVAGMLGTEASVDSMLNVVNGDERGFEDGVSVYITTNTPLILSVSISHAEYWYGAAHPNSGARSYNFDLRTGELVSLSDILKPDYEEKLSALAEKIFKDEINNDFEFVMTDDFTIVPGGLQFNYDPYEIGSYAEGYIDIFIPYAKLKGLIKPGSVLAKWLEQQ